MKKEEIAAEIIKKIIYINIATVCGDGSPWNSPISANYDKNLNFYWASSPKNTHSKNIQNQGKVFVTIYDSTAPEGTGEGVYLSGVAKELTTDDEIKVALQEKIPRLGVVNPKELVSDYQSTSKLRMYTFAPDKVWLNDVVLDDNGAYVHDIRIELNIEELTLLCKKSHS